MDKTKKLKKLILDRYGSIREFSKIVGIPSTTLTSALDKSIGGMAVDRVIKICDELNIDIKTFETLDTNDNYISIKQRKLLDGFKKLNETGKDEAVKRVDELTHISKYTDIEFENKLSYLAPVAAHDDDLTDEEKNQMNDIILKKLKDIGKI